MPSSPFVNVVKLLAYEAFAIMVAVGVLQYVFGIDVRARLRTRAGQLTLLAVVCMILYSLYTTLTSGELLAFGASVEYNRNDVRRVQAGMSMLPPAL